MSDFENSRWADGEFSQNYREAADIFLPLRPLFLEAAKSLYAHFVATGGDGRVLDLGCGDGRFVEELLKSSRPTAVILVDGSADMLAAAQKRLAGRDDIEYIRASFQELLADRTLEGEFDFIFSSLAIHHLPFDEKKALYARIHDLLRPGGCFVHYDVVVSPSEKVENWYMTFWRQWIAAHPDRKAAEKVLGIPDEYKENPDNQPDTLERQLTALRETGFCDVECHLKFGIFALFGGFA